jgi:hypothetical protein
MTNDSSYLLCILIIFDVVLDAYKSMNNWCM